MIKTSSGSKIIWQFSRREAG